jgi:hypothetical protein
MDISSTMLQEIRDSDRVYAMVFRSDVHAADGVQFFTGTDNPFQVGLHHRAAGVRLAPHVHRLDHPLTVTSVQEMLFVRSGKVRVTIYTDTGTTVSTVELGAGDSILLLTGGHGVDFLEDTDMFEVKQGPYPGQANAKIYFGQAAR